MRGASPEQSLLMVFLREFIVEACFDVFKARELARLPCSYCSKYCKNYGILLRAQDGTVRGASHNSTFFSVQGRA